MASSPWLAPRISPSAESSSAGCRRPEKAALNWLARSSRPHEPGNDRLDAHRLARSRCPPPCRALPASPAKRRSARAGRSGSWRRTRKQKGDAGDHQSRRRRRRKPRCRAGRGGRPRASTDWRCSATRVRRMWQLNPESGTDRALMPRTYERQWLTKSIGAARSGKISVTLPRSAAQNNSMSSDRRLDRAARDALPPVRPWRSMAPATLSSRLTKARPECGLNITRRA